MRLLAVIVAEKVREMDDAADHARSWTQPVSCGIGNEMPCRHPNCIERAGHHAAYWTQLAARCAITLESLLPEDQADALCPHGQHAPTPARLAQIQDRTKV